MTQKTNFDRLHELYNLLLESYSIHNDMSQAYLDVGLKAFNMEFGIVSHIDDGAYTILSISPENNIMRQGDCYKLEDTYCNEVLKAGSVLAIDHVKSHPILSQSPVYKTAKLESYLSAPIWVNHKIYGTLSFIASKPKNPPFTTNDLEFMALMANGIGVVIEHNLLEKEKNDAIAAMNSSSLLFLNAFSYAPIGMALVAANGDWLKVNKSLVRITGYNEQELLQTNFQAITHPDDLKQDIKLRNRLLSNKIENYQIEKRYIHKTGKPIWVEISVSLVQDNDKNPLYLIAQIEDITKRKKIELRLKRKHNSLLKANKKLAKLAGHDILTGLPNRRLFKEYYIEELARSSRHNSSFSIAIFDIDFFKSYNDQFGHLEGDIALKRIAKAASGVKRKFDILARFGGEEFIVLLPETNAEQSVMVCERIRASIEKINDLKRTVTVSVGCTTYTPVMGDADNELLMDKIISMADDALYFAKENGRNQVQYFDFHHIKKDVVYTEDPDIYSKK